MDIAETCGFITSVEGRESITALRDKTAGLQGLDSTSLPVPAVQDSHELKEWSQF
jgi:hypothetical protein